MSDVSMGLGRAPASEADQADAVRAISAGEGHEEAGRLLDAVAEYSRAQRLSPDPSLAQHVVRLRHEAAVRGTFGRGPVTWPRDLPDPFPGAQGPPEITAEDLTGSTLGGAILHHGCLIVRGFQGRSDAEAMRLSVIRAIEARDRAVQGDPAPDDDAWHCPFEPEPEHTVPERRWVQSVGGMLMADAPMVMCTLLDVFQRAGATSAIADYLGEPPALSFNKCVLRKVDRSHPTWHQDGSFMGPTVRSVDVWLALSNCGPGTGRPGLDIVPTRVPEILETQTHGASPFPIAIGQGLLDMVAPDHPWVSPTFAPGDAILFDDRFVHRTASSDDAGSERYAIESWFFALSTVPERYVPILAEAALERFADKLRST